MRIDSAGCPARSSRAAPASANALEPQTACLESRVCSVPPHFMHRSRLALLAICQVQGLYGACAQLYADAFAADPDFAESSTADCLRRAKLEKERHDRINVLKTEPRYLAARCAALAGCGLGEDGPKLSDAERAKWRRRAADWLRADLAAWARTLGSDSASRDLAKEMLTLWLAEPDVARLREPGALIDLPNEERQEWTSLWGEVRLRLEEVKRD